MIEWREVRLGEIFNIKSSKRIYASEYVDKGIPFYRSKEVIDIRNNGKTDAEIFITRKRFKEMKKKHGTPKKGDILITSVGTIGTVWHVDREDFYFKDGNLNWIESHENDILSKYIYYWLDSSTGYQSILNQTIGTSQRALTIKDLKQIKIKIPDVATQEKIANILSTYDQLIENNNKRIEILEKTAEEIYKEWFVRMRLPGYENAKFAKGIPEGWEVKKLGNLSKLSYGYTESATNSLIGPKYLRGTDINKESYISWNEVPYCEIKDNEIEKYKLYKNDIVIIRMADPGKVAIIEQDVKAVFASYLIKIEYDQKVIEPYYLFYTLYSDFYQEHYEKYPDYLKQGEKYQIPSDYYEKIKILLSMSEHDANRLPSSGDLTLREWKLVHRFFDKGDIPLESVEGSLLSYDDVQVNRIEKTLHSEKESIQEINDDKLDIIRKDHQPTLNEGLKLGAQSAAIEGATALVLSISGKIREGKSLQEFNRQDWEDVFIDTGKGVTKGGIRGVTIYGMTNYLATPAAVSSAMVTASFGIAEQAYLLRQGRLTELEFITNSEIIALDTSVSALSSLIGQTVIPIPVLGAVIGNTVGMILHQQAKNYLSDKENELVKEFVAKQTVLDEEFQAEYQQSLDLLAANMENYLLIVESAFSQNPLEALESSTKLCIQMGIHVEEILDTAEKIDEYFMN